MSITPSISDVPYTVVGPSGFLPPSASRSGFAAVVLNRGDRPTRAETLGKLEESSFDEVVSILDPQPHYDVEQLAGRLGRTRFLILGRHSSVGSQINLGLRECASPYVLVLWSDMEVWGFTDRVMDRIRSQDVFCVVPSIRTERGATVPSLIAPAFYGPLLRTVPSQPQRDGAITLCPYANVGAFHRGRFARLGGYDPAISNNYWQQLDLGFRAYLWGERVTCVPSFRVNSLKALPPDDTTPDSDYARFHLKNLAIRFNRDSARLPWLKCPSFVSRSGLGLLGGIKEFLRIRRWVKENRFRFVQDARRVTELWEVDE